MPRRKPAAVDDHAEPEVVGERSARERIVLTAERLFAERGFSATSTARVATAAGVPESLVFYYFATKIELLLAIARRHDLHKVRDVGGDRASTRELLERAGTAFADELYHYRYTRAIIFREAHLHPQIQGRAGELIDEATDAVAGVLATATDAVPDPAVIATVARLLVRDCLLAATLRSFVGREDAPSPPDPAVLDVLARAASAGGPSERRA